MLFLHFLLQFGTKINFFFGKSALFLDFSTNISKKTFTLYRILYKMYGNILIKHNIIMRTLKLYGGIILILIAVIVLAASFFTGALTSAGSANAILAGSLLAVILGIILIVVGGKSADKIGGK